MKITNQKVSKIVLDFMKKYPQVVEADVISLKLLAEHLTMLKELVKLGVYDKSVYDEFILDIKAMNIQEHRDRILNELLND